MSLTVDSCPCFHASITLLCFNNGGVWRLSESGMQLVVSWHTYRFTDNIASYLLYTVCVCVHACAPSQCMGDDVSSEWWHWLYSTIMWSHLPVQWKLLRCQQHINQGMHIGTGMLPYMVTSLQRMCTNWHWCYVPQYVGIMEIFLLLVC